MSDHNEQEMLQSVRESVEVLERAFLTAEDRGEVEQKSEDADADLPELNGLNTANGTTQPQEAHINGHAGQAFDLPIRNKESEHTEKVVSAIEEDPAGLEPNGVVEKDKAATEREEAEMSMLAVEKAQELNLTGAGPASTTNNAEVEERSAKANGTTPAKSPRVPTYLKPTASASSRASPKASPARTAASKTPQNISKLNNNLRSASASKPIPSTEPAATTKDTPVPTEDKVKSPVRAARLSHLTAPTVASSARKEGPPSAPAPTKPLGRATSVRSKKPVEGSHFLAPTASSASRKDQPLQNSSSSIQSAMGKRQSLTTSKTTQPTSRKTSAATARPPPSTSTATAQPSSRVPSGSSSGTKQASGSFLERMTRPTAASAGHKADAVKSPPTTSKATGGLGRMGSVRSKAGSSATDVAKRKTGGGSAKKQEPTTGTVTEERASAEVGS